jgi:hypothetical protein
MRGPVATVDHSTRWLDKIHFFMWIVNKNCTSKCLLLEHKSTLRNTSDISPSHCPEKKIISYPLSDTIPTTEVPQNNDGMGYGVRRC